MLVKSLVAECHPEDLEECFKTLRKFHVKLNPAKCAFGVSAGKFLGYIVHHRGIEVNPTKVKAIMDMPAPRTEYEALLAGLRLAEQLGAQNVEVSSNSNLVVQQVNREYEARESQMARYLAMVRELMTRFQHVKVEYVPRAMNTEADLLSRIASSSFPRSSREIRIESLLQKSIEEVADQLCVEDEPSWMNPLLSYLKEEKLPEDDSEVREVKRKARNFMLVSGELYRRSFSQPLLKCI
ncbi:uncharacterized protein LOC127806336 [Diospyros lotus]|uniref:uncharacterized protein LOC127806336 n=1 Tax=Diospyros lotus TaxID=55363 RepID=UPI002259F436|nr:uncharacterized protein LOC127806336 [Diospyros lotus]